MAVGADDIALRRLGHHRSRTRSADHARNAAPLRRGIAMIEVHRTGWESPAAICTRHITQLVEEAGVFLPPSALPLEVSRRAAP